MLVRIRANLICQQFPANPSADIAIFGTSFKRPSLEDSLTGGRVGPNIYVRGLHASTTDELLHSYGKRFGTLVNVRALWGSKSLECKG